ncbi:hypothetical protein PPTG_13193 [Phytophthora nicotianae INRA-310]|uniref:DUF659 domain-containing protein n=1 Tax=Phytophthora nicotianae (strain INRA-310) TaxID=761204 RepID=W2PY16_PHYN3|nr:hypothetical protein PPTG_13193 [Phytophthora nicotianae INRA-310]ETN05818.1 hypothetical protein PPTG_13193 [Phytophthora nicotianae INRA-310]
MAFKKVEHKTLARALKVLTPSTILPSRQQLATSLLDASYEDFRSRLMLKVKVKKVTLTTDGCTDVNGKAVINYVLLAEDTTIFLESVYTGSESHDAPYLASDILRVMELLDFVSIVAVVADNTATNQLVRSTLQQKKPKVFFHGCIFHALHLVVKDLVGRLPWLGQLATDCRKLVRFLKKTDTRWGTIERCFSTIHDSAKILHAFVSSRGFLRARTKEQKAKRRHAYDTVVAKDFVKKMEKAIELLEIISKFEKAFETNTTPPSDVYHVFLTLPEAFRKTEMPISELGKIQQILDQRFNFIYGDAHGVGYILDPRYLGKGMDEDTRGKCQGLHRNVARGRPGE